MSVLNEPCLCLNKHYQLVQFLPVQTAICTLMRDMASALDPETFYLMDFEEWAEHEPKDHEWIKTTRSRIAAPQVIVFKKYGARPPRKLTFTRPNLYKRDDHTCQYCGDPLPPSRLTVEHIMPRSRGGPTSWENCVAACEDCNSRKRDRTPQEAGMKLKKQPAKPNWTPKLLVPRTAKLRASWEPFLKKEGVA